MLRIFIGWEPRVAVQYHVLCHSILEHTSIPVQFIPLNLKTLPLKRMGLTEFTYSRFLVPFLCGFEGPALFLDSDILCAGDIATIAEGVPESAAVSICNTNPAYERAAVMLFNCGHPDNAILTPEYIETAEKLHLIGWTDKIHHLPNRFNYLVGYDRPEWRQGQIPTLVHYTRGVPCWNETKDCELADLWERARAGVFLPAVSWSTLMSHSNHATEGPGGVTIPAPRVPDAVLQSQRA